MGLFVGDCTSDLGFVGTYALTPADVRAAGTVYKNFAENHHFGVGGEYTFNRATEESVSVLALEEAVLIPKTPLGQWSRVTRDFKTGELDARVYIGGSGEF